MKVTPQAFCHKNQQLWVQTKARPSETFHQIVTHKQKKEQRAAGRGTNTFILACYVHDFCSHDARNTKGFWVNTCVVIIPHLFSSFSCYLQMTLQEFGIFHLFCLRPFSFLMYENCERHFSAWIYLEVEQGWEGNVSRCLLSNILFTEVFPALM